MTTRQNKNDRKRQHRKAFAHGRDRSPTPQDQRSPYPKSSQSGRVDPIDTGLLTFADRTFDLSTGAINTVGPDPSLANATTMRLMQEAAAQINQQLASTLLYGQGPAMQAMRYMGAFDHLEDQRPPLKREMAVGEIIGYRCWRLEDGILRSVYMHDQWRPNTILEGRELEDWDQRGIHAWKTADSEEFFAYIRGYLNARGGMPWSIDDHARPCIVTGSIYLWGDVVEHEHGYRAEYASIRSLDWIYPTAEMMGREARTLHYLREQYGVR